MATFTLDDINAAADAKYGSLDIPLTSGNEVRLVNPLRLDKAKRDELFAKKDKTDEGTEQDQAEVFRDMIRLVANHGGFAEELIEALGDDLAKLAIVIEKYTEGTQAGEASTSRD